MPLEQNCNQSVGQLIYVKPVPGFGWQRIPPRASSTAAETSLEPESFHVRVSEFVLENEAIAGGLGQIDQRGHELDGYWVGFFLRSDDEIFNFTTKIGPYNVIIAPEKPQLKPGLRPLHPASVEAAGTPRFRGYAEIAISEDLIS